MFGKGSGFLVRSGQLDTVINLLQQLERDRALLQANAVAYQTHILNHYTMGAYTQRLDDILLEIVSDEGKLLPAA